MYYGAIIELETQLERIALKAKVSLRDTEMYDYCVQKYSAIR